MSQPTTNAERARAPPFGGRLARTPGVDRLPTIAGAPRSEPTVEDTDVD
ncbi:cupredoxin domain-containing protein [Halorubrum xinjiangense]|nr:hypothetical protein [Halorubrum xinjiangense]